MPQTASSSTRAGSFTFFIPPASMQASQMLTQIVSEDRCCCWMCFVNAMNKMSPEIETPVDLLNKRRRRTRVDFLSFSEPEFHFKLAAIVSRTAARLIFHAAK
jgi:hypothetical protein